MTADKHEDEARADIFDILRASLFTGENLTVPDWKPLFSEMQAQAVAALPAKWLPTHLNAEPWLTYCTLQQGQWVRVMHAQDRLLQLMEEHGIPCVILKGSAAAMAYPYPTLRSMGDVDFLVKRCDMNRAAALLESSGYTLTHEKDADSHHYGYAKDHISFELHKRVPLISEFDEDRMAFFENGIDEREWHETEGYRFPVFPAVLNGLVLIFHINQHLRSGLGLRQIIDWMMYVHTLSPEKWEELQPLLKSTGQERLAKTVTLMCQRYLGLEKIVEEDVSLPVDDLMAYIMEKGNFGRKAGLDGSIAAFGLSSTVKGGFFRRLQAGGMSRWKAARKHAVLRPFAWIYQAFRILGLMVKNKKGPKKILEQSRHGVEQRELIEALGLQMDRTVPN